MSSSSAVAAVTRSSSPQAVGGLPNRGPSQSGLVGIDGERFIWVMDPMTRKLKVPLNVIDPTQATATPGTVPSLCMLFLDGKCKHPACRQVHVSAPVLQQLRKDAQQAPSCCSAHGDLRDNHALVSNFVLVSIVGGSQGGNSPTPTPSQPSPVPTDEVAPPPLPPPMYGSSSSVPPPAAAAVGRGSSCIANAGQRQSHQPAHAVDAFTEARAPPQPTTPELNGAMYPALPGNNPIPPPPTWSPQTNVSGTSAVAAAGAAAASTTSSNTNLQLSGNNLPATDGVTSSSTTQQPEQPPPQSAREILCTVPSNKVAMTVGLQRFLAHSGFLGRSNASNSPTPTHNTGGGGSPVETFHQPMMVDFNGGGGRGGGGGPHGASHFLNSSTSSSSTSVSGPQQQQQPQVQRLFTATTTGSKENDNFTLEIPLKMICRLHLSHKCRYLEDCNNVHICRELEPKIPASAGNHPSLGPQHSHEILCSLRPKITTSTTVSNTLYNVKVISTGQITDTDMHQIVMSYKVQHPSVQLRIVDCRGSSTSNPPGATRPHQGSYYRSHSGMLPHAMDYGDQHGDHHHNQHQQVLFKAPGAPISPQTSPQGPTRTPAMGNPGGVTSIGSQFAGPGTSPLLQGTPNPPPPFFEPGAAYHHSGEGGVGVSLIPPGSDEPAVAGQPSWTYASH